MSLRERVPPYQHGETPIRAPADESDAEEEALVNDYREQVQYDGGMESLDRTTSLGGSQDIHAQLQAAATPLEFQATLETKFASYDNYCSLFHFILNSDGPVDLEVPSVRNTFEKVVNGNTNINAVLLGLGCYRRIYLPVQQFLQLPPKDSSQGRK